MPSCCFRQCYLLSALILGVQNMKLFLSRPQLTRPSPFSRSLAYLFGAPLLAACDPISAPPKLHDNAGPVPACVPDISGDLPPPAASPDDAGYDRFKIPSMADLGVEPPAKALRFRGGEREALSRFEVVMVSTDAVAT